MSDLFGSAAEGELRDRGPLAARLRPRHIDEVVGQEHLLGPGRPLRRLVEQDRLQSVIFWGPAGTGKTSLALAIAGSTAAAFEQLSAVSAGVKDVREVIDRARERLGMHGQRTILFLDEIHRFSKSQQDALLPAVEDGTLILIGATTENPYFEVNAPLRSRSTLFRLEPLDGGALGILIARAAAALGYSVEPAAAELLLARAAGDGRQVLTALDVASALVDTDVIDIAAVEAALNTTAFRYGRDDHFDVISAFIKSVRGSDAQAAVFYLARMLEAGEDPRFIARRLVVLASEDIGLADPQALVQAVAAAHAVEFVGLPEAQLNLAQATLYLSLAPKSNRLATAIWSARSDLAGGDFGEVPAHLRDAHYAGAAALGHGIDYRYPHDHPGGWVPQQYLPDALEHKVWYTPSGNGFEETIGATMDAIENRRSTGEKP